MALPSLQPRQQSSLSILPPTGTYANVAPNLPYGIYAASPSFISGAVEQVSFTYAMLAGDVVDIELYERQVYAAYELATLEWSYQMNLHQAKNSLSSFLGSPTGTFDQHGTIVSGSALSGTNAALKYPKFSLAYERNVSAELSYESGIGGTVPFYSASVPIVMKQQDYDLQQIVVNQAATDTVLATALTASNNGQIRVNKVYFKSPSQMWRFFGYYGGLSVVGNLNTYGQYADDSTFEVIPAWQNKLQAINYEDNLYTRTSHFSYEIRNNKIRLFPPPTVSGPMKVWFIFSFAPNPLSPAGDAGVNGVNNLNTLPFENIPYESINSMGKHWIKRYALAIEKGMLSNSRGKFLEVPIPGGSVTLNHATLLTQSTEEMDKLLEEVKTILNELTYPKLVETDANIIENVAKVHTRIPKAIYVR